MKNFLTGFDRALFDKRIAEVELQIKSQVVLAIVKRCDNYSEIPWKAFAIGASTAALIVVALDMLMMRWMIDTVILLSVVAVLGSGTVLAMLTLDISRFRQAFSSKKPHGDRDPAIRRISLPFQGTFYC